MDCGSIQFRCHIHTLMNDESPEKYRQWVATNFDSDIKEQLFDIYKESMHDAKDDPCDQNGAARISKTIAKACTLMARLSADQAKAARKIEVLTYVLIALTAILVFDVLHKLYH